jgi:hypothetical protein
MEEVEDEPLFADRVAGLDIAKAAVEVTHPGAQRHRRGPAPARDPDLRYHPPGTAGPGRLAGLLGGDQGRRRGSQPSLSQQLQKQHERVSSSG